MGAIKSVKPVSDFGIRHATRALAVGVALALFCNTAAIAASYGAFENIAGLGECSSSTKLEVGGGAGDFFGFSVDISGDTVIAGGPFADNLDIDAGAGYLFIKTGGSWILEDTLLASNGAADDQFGFSVAIDGDIAVVGAPFHDDLGSVYVFRRSAGVWTEEQELIGHAAGDQFGYSVDVAGDTIIVGARFDDTIGVDAGAAYTYTDGGGFWVPEDALLAGDGAAGDEFGVSVSIDGDWAIVGAYLHDHVAIDAGAAYMFDRTGGVWSEQDELLPSPGAAGDLFGFDVAVTIASPDRAIVGAPNDDTLALDAGAAYTYTRTGSIWPEDEKLTASDGLLLDAFGTSVAIDNDVAVIGAPGTDDLGANSGSAYVFEWQGGSWNELDKLLSSDGMAGDDAGFSVAVDGETIVVGARGAGSFGVEAGAAYVYECPENSPPIANAGGPYEAECSGLATSVELDGTGSDDPDTGPSGLLFDWTSDCPGASFDDPTSATPTLTMTSPPACPVDCSTTLTVTDPLGLSDTQTVGVRVEDTVGPDLTGLLEPAAPLPPSSPRSVCSAPASRDFFVRCSAADTCDPTPTMQARLVVSNHDVPGGGVCDPRVESFPVACDELIRIELLPAACPARPRSASPAVLVNSVGVQVFRGESVMLEVTAVDACANGSALTFDPTVEPAPTCDIMTETGECCPALSQPEPEECKLPTCGTGTPIGAIRSTAHPGRGSEACVERVRVKKPRSRSERVRRR